MGLNEIHQTRKMQSTDRLVALLAEASTRVSALFASVFGDAPPAVFVLEASSGEESRKKM